MLRAGYFTGASSNFFSMPLVAAMPLLLAEQHARPLSGLFDVCWHCTFIHAGPVWQTSRRAVLAGKSSAHRAAKTRRISEMLTARKDAEARWEGVAERCGYKATAAVGETGSKARDTFSVNFDHLGTQPSERRSA